MKLHRSALEEDIGSNANRLAIWVTILMWASRFETTIAWKGLPRKVPAGTVMFGMAELASKLALSRKTVHKHLHYLQTRGSISMEVVTQGTLVTICNWKDYQNQQEGGGNTEVTRGIQRGEHGGNNGAALIGEEKKERIKERGDEPDHSDQLIRDREAAEAIEAKKSIARLIPGLFHDFQKELLQ